MTHMVIFRTAEGKPDYHQADDLAEAMAFVERLRNEDSISDARIFHMEEVPIEFRAYYRVEVTAAPPAEEVAAPGPQLVEPQPVPVPEPVLETTANGSGRHGLFSRS